MAGSRVLLRKIFAYCCAVLAVQAMAAITVSAPCAAQTTYVDSMYDAKRWARPYVFAGPVISRPEYQSFVLSNEACQLIDQHNYPAAVARLKVAMSLAPHLANVHANMGLALNRMGYGPQAIEYLKTAVGLAPQEPAPLLTLGSAYERCGRLKDALSTYQAFVQRFPFDQDTPVVKALIVALQKEIDHIASVVNASGGTTSLDDYYVFAVSQKNMRWHRPVNRLKVYVAEGTGTRGCSPSSVSAVHRAFEQWQKVGSFGFEFVGAKDRPDITCNWTDSAASLDNAAEGGEARLSCKDSGISSCSISLLSMRGSAPASEGEVYAVALHEIGHALGIVGHSPNPDDIMYCTIKTECHQPTLSTRDVETLHKIYPVIGASSN